jgi:apolipoprotein N-acyltransferase
VSGAATALAFPPVDWGPLAFVALVPLALVFRASGRAMTGLLGRGRAMAGAPVSGTPPGRPPLGAGTVALASAAFGAVFFGLLFPWIHLFGMAAYLLLTGVETAFVAAALAAGTLLRRRLPSRLAVLAFPVAFLAGEYARSHLPLGGFPWGGLGYSQHNDALVLRLAAYTGVWGVSFLVALVNALVAEAAAAAWSGRRERRAAAPLVAGAAQRLVVAGTAVPLLAAAVLVALPGLLPVPTPNGARATVALVQGNPPLQDPADPHALDQVALDDQVRETAALGGKRVSLVVWPESSVGHDPFTDPALLGPLESAIHAAGAPFLVGATLPVAGTPGVDGGASRFRNESLFFHADGSLAGRYVKMHLVPFGEYVPGRQWLAGWIKELDRVPADGIPGRTPTVFRIPQGVVGSVICYETAYPELVGAFVARGARLIVVSTDNSSYRRSAASAQMVAISQLRAAEQRMWVTQAAITGISAVIAPDGHVVAETGLFQPALLTPTVRFATTTTIYGRFGDWFPVLILAAALAALVPRPQRARPPVPAATSAGAPARRSP